MTFARGWIVLGQLHAVALSARLLLLLVNFTTAARTTTERFLFGHERRGPRHYERAGTLRTTVVRRRNLRVQPLVFSDQRLSDTRVHQVWLLLLLLLLLRMV